MLIEQIYAPYVKINSGNALEYRHKNVFSCWVENNITSFEPTLLKVTYVISLMFNIEYKTKPVPQFSIAIRL